METSRRSHGSRKHLPRRVIVADVLSCRYAPGERPVSWDERRSGYETIRTTTGELIKLASSGGQSSPAKGWELLLTKKSVPDAVEWTLYGIVSRLVNKDIRQEGGDSERVDGLSNP